MKIETDVTRLLGIDLPILQAGMSWASSNATLPLAVSRAGGLGVIAAGPMYLDALEQAIDTVRAGTDKPFAVNMPLYRKGAEEVLDLLEAKRIPVLIASQGGPQKYLDRFKAVGTTCLHVVASELHAQKAAEKGVDGLIVVGGEAGGHPPADLVTTLVLVRAVARATGGRIPLIASVGSPMDRVWRPRWPSARGPRTSAPVSSQHLRRGSPTPTNKPFCARVWPTQGPSGAALA